MSCQDNTNKLVDKYRKYQKDIDKLVVGYERSLNLYPARPRVFQTIKNDKVFLEEIQEIEKEIQGVLENIQNEILC
jgi:hypothetical protein